jgi:hypothetical protein
MTTPHDGGPAFPIQGKHWGPEDTAYMQPGQSRRFYAAVQIATGLAPRYGFNDAEVLQCARHAFKIADALLIVEQEAK